MDDRKPPRDDPPGEQDTPEAPAPITSSGGLRLPRPSQEVN